MEDPNVAIQTLITVVDEQKGELLFLQIMLLSVIRSLPEKHTELLGHFEGLVERQRGSILYSQASETVISAFEHYVKIHTGRKT